MRFHKRVLLALSAIFVALPLLAASPASAEPLNASAPTAISETASYVAAGDTTIDKDESEGRAVSADEQGKIDEAVGSNKVTINRWKSATSGFDSNLGGWDFQNIGAGLSRETLQGFMMTMGNLSWDIAANLSAFSSSANLIEGMIWYIDNSMAVILQAFMNPSGGASLLGIITVIAIVSVLIGTMYRTRGAELWKRVGATLIIAALFWTTAAQLTGPQGPINKTPASYQPQAPTPSWMVLKTTQVLDKASTLSTGIALDGIKPASSWRYGDRALGCDKYMATIEEEAMNVGSGVSGTNAGKRQFQMRTVVDRLWRESGLRTWINAQYGANNGIKYSVFCYHLDVRSENVSSSEAYKMIRDVGQANGISDMTGFLNPKDSKRASESAVVNPPTGDARMGAMLGWAICNWQPGPGGGNFTATLGADFPGFHNSENQDKASVTNWFGKGGGGIDGGWSDDNVQEQCTNWRAAGIDGNWSDDEELKAFFVPGHQSAISSAVESIDRGELDDSTTSRNRMSDFLASMIGTGAGGGSMATLAYSALAPLGTLPISIMSIAKLLAELMLVFSVVTIMLSLLGGLFTRNPFGEKLIPALKQMVMVAVLAVGVGTAMSLLLVVSNALATIGVTILGQGSLMTTVWTSLAPLMSLIGMSYVWKKVFKAPSPFSAKGLGAWMKGSPAGAAALGSAVGSGVGSYAGNRLARAGRGLARSAGNRAMASVNDKFMGGRNGKRKSGMQPGRDSEKDRNKFDPNGIERSKAEIKAQDKAEKNQMRIEQAKARAEVRASRPSLARGMGLDRASREAHRQQLDLQGKQGLGRAASWLNHSVGAGALNRGSDALVSGASQVKSGFTRAAADARNRYAEMREAGATGIGSVMSAAGAYAGSHAESAVQNARDAAAFVAPVVTPAAAVAATMVGGPALTGVALGAVAAAQKRGQAKRANNETRENVERMRRNAEKLNEQAQKIEAESDRANKRDQQIIDRTVAENTRSFRDTLDRGQRQARGRDGNK